MKSTKKEKAFLHSKTLKHLRSKVLLKKLNMINVNILKNAVLMFYNFLAQSNPYYDRKMLTCVFFRRVETLFLDFVLTCQDAMRLYIRKKLQHKICMKYFVLLHLVMGEKCKTVLYNLNNALNYLVSTGINCICLSHIQLTLKLLYSFLSKSLI